jgi:putative ABC transport system ATP-binding protein
VNEPFILVSGLCKAYNTGRLAVQALDGITLDIPDQTFLVVMGPSGSGKSTLLHLLGGLDRPSSGSIWVGGQALDTLDENALAVYRRKMVGFIFQSFNLIPGMTAFENVAFPLRFDRIPRKERERRASRLLEKVGLAERAFHRPTELSGGEQQRVAIARALIHDPNLILADEPTGNLDSASGIKIMEILAEMHRDGRTVLVVTHDPRMIPYATQAIQLLDGQIVDGMGSQN